MALPGWPIYQGDANGLPYMFQIYPEITSITPSVGSVAGGTVVKLTGTGFPSAQEFAAGVSTAQVILGECTGYHVLPSSLPHSSILAWNSRT
jgi:IPT/TIG domain